MSFALAMRREPAPLGVEVNGGWPLLAEQDYVAECPAGGHDAVWAGRGYGQNDNTYEFRTIVTVDCRVCP